MSQLHQGQWITFKRQQMFKNFKIMALKDNMTGHHHIILQFKVISYILLTF